MDCRSLVIAAAVVAVIFVFMMIMTGRQDKKRRRLIPEPDGRRWILVLDLDETLIHSYGPDFERYATRPHLHPFLKSARNLFDEIVVFTAGTRDYAEPILDALDPSGEFFGRRLYRDSCVIEGDGRIVKDLKRALNVDDLLKVVFVDNLAANFELQPRCGLLVESFYGDRGDDALIDDVLPELVRRRLLWGSAL